LNTYIPKPFVDASSGLSITGDFPTGSAGEIRTLGEDAYEILPKPEPVPDWFFEALQVNFGGAGVPREYAFHVRAVSKDARRVKLRFRFTETNGAGYMDPPYWVRRRGRWQKAPASDVFFASREYCDIEIDLAENEPVQIANKPYMELDEVDWEVDEIVSSFPFFSQRIFGSTAEGRPLVVLETEPREEKILVHATMQPAEPAAEPILAIAHWLGDRSQRANRLLERFQFCLIPLPNPDGSFHGRSVTNGEGEVPMFSFGRHLEGASAPVETRALWDYVSDIKPTGFIEFHTHYQGTRFHKLNPISLDWFPEEMHDRVTETNASLLRVNDQWRVTELTPETPIVTAGKFVNLASHFGTIGYCYQIYSPTIEATCTQAIAATDALACGLAGEAWRKESRAPEIVPG
jgi:hypothetical protein